MNNIKAGTKKNGDVFQWTQEELAAYNSISQDSGEELPSVGKTLVRNEVRVPRFYIQDTRTGVYLGKTLRFTARQQEDAVMFDDLAQVNRLRFRRLGTPVEVLCPRVNLRYATDNMLGLKRTPINDDYNMHVLKLIRD